MSSTLVKGTAVVSLADGAKLGIIDHVYLDPRRKEIVGFTFHQGGVFGGKSSGLVEIDDVHAFGPDAVTVDDLSAVHSDLAVNTRCDDLMDLEDLLKRKVMTEGGTFVGQVVSIRFGHDSHCLSGLEVSPGLFQDRRLIPGDAVEHIGAELVVISDTVYRPEVSVPLAPPPRLVRVA